MFDLRMAVADDIVIIYGAFFVSIDESLLFCLYILRQLKTIEEFGKGAFKSLQKDWSIRIFKIRDTCTLNVFLPLITRNTRYVECIVISIIHGSRS